MVYYIIGVWIIISIFLSINTIKMVKDYGVEVGKRMFFAVPIFNILSIVQWILTFIIAYLLWQIEPLCSVIIFIVQPLIIGPIIRGIYDV